MSEIQNLTAMARERAGKGPARAARRDGQVPGVIYGTKKNPALITMEGSDLMRQLKTGSFFATLYDIDLGGKKERVLPRDVQFDPVSDRPLHVDFLRVSAATQVTVQVPVNFLNEEEAPGLKRGGLLNVVRHEIEFACRADAIPSQIDIDLTGLEIGDSIHISMISLPEGVEPTIGDRDFTVATIAAPTVIQEEAEEAEVAEGEEEFAEAPEEAAAEEGGEES
jgi:large subunit ribosomal protein L25